MDDRARIAPADGRSRGRARRARARAREGLPQVGVLDSSRYASLHPGYWIVFSGVYATEAEATSALEDAGGRGPPRPARRPLSRALPSRATAGRTL